MVSSSSEPIVSFGPSNDSKDPFIEFRDACIETTGYSLISPFSNITMVGVSSLNNCQLQSYDHGYLHRAITTCQATGIKVSKQFTLTLMNLPYGERGDFLKYPPPTDLLIICFIYNGHYRDPQYEPLSQSDDHFKRGAWYDAAKKAGAKAIITYGRHPAEVTAYNFLPPSRSDENIYKARISHPLKLISGRAPEATDFLLHKNLLVKPSHLSRALHLLGLTL